METIPEAEGGKGGAEGWRDETGTSHIAIPNSTLDEAGEEPPELPPPVLRGEGTLSPRPLTPPPIPPVVITVGLFNPEDNPNSDAVGPLFL